MYFQEGTKEYRNNELRNAIYFYTEGLKVNCKDVELNAKLYNDRAIAYFNLGKNELDLYKKQKRIYFWKQKIGKD